MCTLQYSERCCIERVGGKRDTTVVYVVRGNRLSPISLAAGVMWPGIARRLPEYSHSLFVWHTETMNYFVPEPDPMGLTEDRNTAAFSTCCL